MAIEKAVCTFCFDECGMNKVQMKKDYAGKQYICYNCYARTKINDFLKISKMTADEVKPYISEAEQSRERFDEFKSTVCVAGLLEADYRDQYWLIPDGHFSDKTTVHLFCDIKSNRFVENGNVTDKADISAKLAENKLFFADFGDISKKGLFSRAPKCEMMQIIIETDSLTEPQAVIELIKAPERYDSSAYKNACESAKECFALLDKLIADAKPLEQDDDEDESE